MVRLRELELSNTDLEITWTRIQDIEKVHPRMAEGTGLSDSRREAGEGMRKLFCEAQALYEELDLRLKHIQKVAGVVLDDLGFDAGKPDGKPDGSVDVREEARSPAPAPASQEPAPAS